MQCCATMPLQNVAPSPGAPLSSTLSLHLGVCNAPSRCVQYSYTCHTKQPQRISSRGRCGYVSQRRLESAKAMIATGRASLGQIALDCQFSSQSSFTRAFRRATGMTPAEYRRTLR
ncbi:MAG: helix-turn-helix transcriptional regulator [Xanthobacteraceae bacterium]